MTALANEYTATIIITATVATEINELTACTSGNSAMTSVLNVRVLDILFERTLLRTCQEEYHDEVNNEQLLRHIE